MRIIPLVVTIASIMFQFIVCTDSEAQTLFRSGMFFHHSTGECIWGPNGSSTSVPQEITRYNTQHSYSGQNAVTLNETWFPLNYDNDWYLWHTIFETNFPENITNYFSGNKIIIIKSCFPSSAIEEWGQPLDTTTPDYKTVYNYKWHWRHILTVMKNNPQNFFVIWTNAPLTQAETNPASAMLSKMFCKWAKDTLAQGLDPVFGTFPANVYVFDFFSKLTDANGYLQLIYASSPNDPHPNGAATALVAPLFVNEVFDHSVAYEHVFGIKKLGNKIPESFILFQNYPNPFNPASAIRFGVPKNSLITLKIYNIQGKEIAVLVNEILTANNYEVIWDAGGYPSGIYFYSLQNK